MALLAAVMLVQSAAAQSRQSAAPTQPPPMEAYPVGMLDRLAIDRDRRISAGKVAGVSDPAAAVAISRRWTIGQLVRVAFSGGSRDLHQSIERAALAWTAPLAGANLRLSFRNDDGSYRIWNRADDRYLADIRIDFAQDPKNGGYWSLIGSDAVNPKLVLPGEATMNLAHFDVGPPADWHATVLHEFGHALGFQHAHQSPLAQCKFRFYDDPGYRRVTGPDGRAVRDGNQRRPGLYTLMGGPPWRWKRSKIDANLKEIARTDEFLTRDRYDNLSIMRYHFPADFFAEGARSPCYSEHQNERLSKFDALGARTAYPWDASRDLIAARQIVRQLVQGVKPDSPLAESIRAAMAMEAAAR